MPAWTWIPVGMNVAGCAMNCWMTIRGYRRAKHYMEESDKIAQSMVPCVAVCKILADDARLPDTVRNFARQALPANTTITIESKTVSARVH